jgi:hypothetical protein
MKQTYFLILELFIISLCKNIQWITLFQRKPF